MYVKSSALVHVATIYHFSASKKKEEITFHCD